MVNLCTIKYIYFFIINYDYLTRHRYREAEWHQSMSALQVFPYLFIHGSIYRFGFARACQLVLSSGSGTTSILALSPDDTWRGY